VRLFRSLPCLGLGLGLAVATACGGTTRHGTNGGAAGSDDGGSSNVAGGSHGGSGNVAGKANGGSSAVAGSAGASQAGAGSGGKRPDDPIPQGGDSGQDPLLSCDTPYAGPTGGPRVDGPEPTGSCAAIGDAQLVARYDDFKARVPQGLYYEAASPFQTWELPCSNSLAETSERASKLNLGTAKGKFTTDWFYEVEFCDGNARGVYRNIRCDYYDGQKLNPATPENLAFLHSLLWWAENWNHSGSTLLGYAVTVGNATDWIEMCSLEATYGDFGLCDEVRLMSAQDSVMFGGGVKLGDTKLLRTAKGKCH
jgi:hypothetical protein